MFTLIKFGSDLRCAMTSTSSMKTMDGDRLLASQKILSTNIGPVFAISIAETGKNDTPAFRAKA